MRIRDGVEEIVEEVLCVVGFAMSVIQSLGRLWIGKDRTKAPSNNPFKHL